MNAEVKMFCVLSAFIAVLMQNLPVVNINFSNHRVDGKSGGQGEDHLKLRFGPGAVFDEWLLRSIRLRQT